jgi:hypothetical protein
MQERLIHAAALARRSAAIHRPTPHYRTRSEATAFNRRRPRLRLNVAILKPGQRLITEPGAKRLPSTGDGLELGLTSQSSNSSAISKSLGFECWVQSLRSWFCNEPPTGSLIHAKALARRSSGCLNSPAPFAGAGINLSTTDELAVPLRRTEPEGFFAVRHRAEAAVWIATRGAESYINCHLSHLSFGSGRLFFRSVFANSSAASRWE